MFFEVTSIEALAVTQPNTFKWSKVDGAKEYIVRISGQDISNFSLIGEKTSLEIPYSTLRFTSEDKKKPPLEVNIDVLAIGDSDVIGEGRNFKLSKYLHCFQRTFFKVVIKTGGKF